MSSNKQRDMVASDDDDEYDEDYEEECRSDDKLLRKIGMLCWKRVEYKSIIKRLKMDLRLSKSHARQTKCKMWIDYNWDGKEANFVDLVSTFLRNICFHVIRFWRTNGWNMMMDQKACRHLYRGRWNSQKEGITRINGREWYAQPFIQIMSP